MSGLDAVDARRRYIDGVRDLWAEHAMDCAGWLNEQPDSHGLRRAREAAARAAADRLEWMYLVRHDRDELLAAFTGPNGRAHLPLNEGER